MYKLVKTFQRPFTYYKLSLLSTLDSIINIGLRLLIFGQMFQGLRLFQGLSLFHSLEYVTLIHTKYYKVRCDFKTTLTPLCHPYQIAETSILDSRKEILTKMQLPRAIITSKLEKCLKITHLPTSSKKSDKKGKIAIRIFFPFQQNFPLLPCPLFGNCISLSIVSAESQ